jgi:hypothetical protein
MWKETTNEHQEKGMADAGKEGLRFTKINEAARPKLNIFMP